jgi:hypothetical protein
MTSIHARMRVARLLIGLVGSIMVCGHVAAQGVEDVLPDGAYPFKAVPLTGSMVDSGRPLGDRISVSGTFLVQRRVGPVVGQ